MRHVEVTLVTKVRASTIHFAEVTTWTIAVQLRYCQKKDDNDDDDDRNDASSLCVTNKYDFEDKGKILSHFRVIERTKRKTRRVHV